MIDLKYIQIFDISAKDDLALYAHPYFEAGDLAIQIFFTVLSEELDRVGGDINQSPIFQKALQRLRTHYLNNRIVKGESSTRRAFIGLLLRQVKRTHFTAASDIAHGTASDGVSR